MVRLKRTMEDWPCPNPNCDKRFVFKQSLNNHKESCKHAAESDVSSLACNVCNKIFCHPDYLSKCISARGIINHL